MSVADSRFFLRLTGEVLQIVQSVPQLVKGMTGVDVTAQVLKLNYSNLFEGKCFMIIRFQLLDGRPGRRIWRRAPYPPPQDGGGGRAGGERRGNAQRDRVEGERITSQIVLHVLSKM